MKKNKNASGHGGLFGRLETGGRHAVRVVFFEIQSGFVPLEFVLINGFSCDWSSLWGSFSALLCFGHRIGIENKASACLWRC